MKRRRKEKAAMKAAQMKAMGDCNNSSSSSSESSNSDCGECMGKCRDGPNVRVLNQCNGNALEKEVGGSITNPLCVSVGLEDVGTIVANFFGEKKDMGMMAAA
ncbi:hypothetical protein MRB53_030475 [Persea americana]|uniref:Uncharacterized protein n=1 Tax=Persea americana TaxID=3435 RepID=A0ACC2KLF6_PERAE|nr:hypothetical protein MRB53_030475 [Persea americana]